ncbi:hypothetical protein HYALB_00008047 [Hymenoscyphus albidus]|uniref:Phytochrome n=1 Tax=Hymenoscyphus albidus TaxID=595503 RepID=A0A9N9Q6I4_9HELO|nr:hypothetical protein HYALB_00008047 [Hymenoscyphus albidus]
MFSSTGTKRPNDDKVSALPSSDGTRIERVFPIRIQVQSTLENAPQPASTKPQSSCGEETDSPDPETLITVAETANTFESQYVATDTENTVTTSGKFFLTNRFSYFQEKKDKKATGSESASDIESTSGKEGEHPKPSSTTSEKIYRCEDEPIHIPGAIQNFGALIAIRENPDGVFIVRIVSENSEQVTGLDPEALFDLRCFTDILFHDDKTEFVQRARSLRTRQPEETARTNPDVFTISLTSLLGAPEPVFCAIHCNAGSDLIICEFEPKNDVFQAIAPGLPTNPIPITDDQAAEPEVIQPNLLKSKPLRINRESGRQLGSMELFHILCEVQTQLAQATTLQSLLDVTVGLVYELTGFDRVMVYQFDETKAGCVVSEYFNAKASRDSYLNLHFPASDIPKQARDLYVVNKIRVLYDREEETARLMCRTKEDAETPLDLKHSYLRAMSPIHLKYLRNMGVRSCMSISLMVDNQLWGLISCHNYGLGMRVSLPVRELCRSLGENCSVHIEKLLYEARIKVRKPLTAASTRASPTAFIAASSSDLLNMFNADFGFLAIKGEARTIGKLCAYNEAVALLQYIRQKTFTGIFATQNVKKDCPDIAAGMKFLVLVGMLVVPLALNGVDFLVFFRKTKEKEILWAGNPNEKKIRPGTAYLEPRSSFQRWTQQVIGTSREWTEDQIESAAVLSTLYGRFIEVWRQKDSIFRRNRMTRLLIRNAGHEVRTPLNSIINYLEVALEEPLDERARQHLFRSLQASKALVFVVNDLLSLTEVEDIDFKIHEDNVNLRKMISELMVAFGDESKRRGMPIEFHDDKAIPNVVRCDPAGLRQVLLNLLTNSFEHGTNSKVISIEMKKLGSTDGNTLVEISFQDQGAGLCEQELDRIFQDLEQVLDEDEAFEATKDEEEKEKEKASETPAPKYIGLGLAFTARFVRLNRGQMSMSSELGKGTRVSIKIPFRNALQVKTVGQGSIGLLSPPTPPSELAGRDPLAIPWRESPEAPSFGQLTLQTVPPKVKRASSTSQVTASSSRSSSATISPTMSRNPFPESGVKLPKFHVLVAEDNPLNSRLLETRLVKRGHTVKVTVDGQACADTFRRNPEAFDVILMDLQVCSAPYKLLEFESEQKPKISSRAATYGRVPIIAVSASLTENALDDYLNIGFDGWILKPIDFQRLEAILAAIQDHQVRELLLYGREKWDRGGWFKPRASKDSLRESPKESGKSQKR